MIELRPCPFCGGKVHYNYNINLEPDGVTCAHCMMIVRFARVKPIQKGESYGDVQKRIADCWNKREGTQDGR